jgi:hypothetical protein
MTILAGQNDTSSAAFGDIAPSNLAKTSSIFRVFGDAFFVRYGGKVLR